MSRRARKPIVILHFCCDPAVLTDHGVFLNKPGYRVIHSNNGFETIQFSTSGKIDALVLELDRNQRELLFIAREIKRVRASIPTIVVAHEKKILDGLRDVADAVVPEELGSGMLVKSLEGFLRKKPVDRIAATGY